MHHRSLSHWHRGQTYGRHEPPHARSRRHARRVGTFFLGFIMIVAGGYLLTDQVMVTSGAWRWGDTMSLGCPCCPCFWALVCSS